MNAVDITRISAKNSDVSYTDEQLSILNRPPTQVLVVEAGAGTGKTSTLAGYSRQWRDYRGLYIAFNKDIAQEAQSRFPPWVRAQTLHSYAYQALGVSRFKDRLTGRIRRQTIREAGINVYSEYLTPDRMMRAILNGMVNFCNDGGNELKAEHCGIEGLSQETRNIVLQKIAAIIKQFLNYEESGLPFTHDMYLKRLEMFGSIGEGFDYIMVDEAQDSNGVTLSLVRNSGKPVIYIGDAKQSIYAFRGAINAMTMVEGERYPLSMSWRFGPEIAKICNHILSYSDEKPLAPIRGREDRETRIERFEGKAPGRAFLLSRTNARLFEGLIGLIEQPGRPATTFHVAGGFDIFANQLKSAWALSRNDQFNVTDPYVRSFANWEDMVEESQEFDPDAKKLVKIVTDYGDQIPDIIEKLRMQHRAHYQDAQIILSTAHKAKGLEADTVVILDDFPTLKELQARLLENTLPQIDYEQEINLLYVACSRARYRLVLAPGLYDEMAHIIQGVIK